MALNCGSPWRPSSAKCDFGEKLFDMWPRPVQHVGVPNAIMLPMNIPAASWMPDRIDRCESGLLPMGRGMAGWFPDGVGLRRAIRAGAIGLVAGGWPAAPVDLGVGRGLRVSGWVGCSPGRRVSGRCWKEMDGGFCGSAFWEIRPDRGRNRQDCDPVCQSRRQIRSRHHEIRTRHHEIRTPCRQIRSSRDRGESSFEWIESNRGPIRSPFEISSSASRHFRLYFHGTQHHLHRFPHRGHSFQMQAQGAGKESGVASHVSRFPKANLPPATCPLTPPRPLPLTSFHFSGRPPGQVPPRNSPHKHNTSHG